MTRILTLTTFVFLVGCTPASPIVAPQFTLTNTPATKHVVASKNLGAIVDSKGNIYTSGWVEHSDSKTVHWTIRKSQDSGQTWSMVDEFSLPQGAYASTINLSVDAEDKLFACGSAENADKESFAIVRASTDGGSTWTTVDQFKFEGSKTASYYRITSGKDGDLYAVGNATITIENSEVARAFVRASFDHGRSWKTVYTSNTPDDKAHGDASLAILAASDGVIWMARGAMEYPAGRVYPTTRNQIWKSENKGETWTLSDDYENPGKSGGYISFFEDSKKVIWALGSTWRKEADGEPRSKQPRASIMRKSEDGGKTWTTADIFFLSELNSEYYAMSEDEKGKLVVVGYATDADFKYHSIIRTSIDRGQNWTTLQDDQGSQKLGAHNYFVTFSPLVGFVIPGWNWELPSGQAPSVAISRTLILK